MPQPAAAAPVTAAPVKTAQVGWAALCARANTRASPDLIRTWLGVGAEHAQDLMSELVRQKVVHAPIAGSAAAIKPMYGGGGLNSRVRVARKTVEQAKEVFDALLEDPDAEPPEVCDEAS